MVGFSGQMERDGTNLWSAAEISWARGELSGVNSANAVTFSIASDKECELDVGYTLSRFTPFIGYGRFVSSTEFVEPSPILCSFRHTGSFAVCGINLLSQLTECLHYEVRAKARYMYDGKQTIVREQGVDSITLAMRNKMHYEIELPITYSFSLSQTVCATTISPFYRYIHFGGRENFPFNFQETKYRIMGGRVLVSATF